MRTNSLRKKPRQRRPGSVVKSANCTCRGPELSVPFLDRDYLQVQFLGIQCPPSGLYTHTAQQCHADASRSNQMNAVSYGCVPQPHHTCLSRSWSMFWRSWGLGRWSSLHSWASLKEPMLDLNFILDFCISNNCCKWGKRVTGRHATHLSETVTKLASTKPRSTLTPFQTNAPAHFLLPVPRFLSFLPLSDLWCFFPSECIQD